jgi:hypothetical protein
MSTSTTPPPTNPTPTTPTTTTTTTTPTTPTPTDPLVQRYNNLKLIWHASNQFQPTVDKVLQDPDLSTLFGEAPPVFGVWLLHRHFKLDDGERMVAHDSADPNIVSITYPVKSSDWSNVAPERWDPMGGELEYRNASTPPPKPSIEFLNRFQAILDKNGATNMLGVCLADTLQGLGEGEIFLEKTHKTLLEDPYRQQIVTKVQSSTPAPGLFIFPAAWILNTANPPSQSPLMTATTPTPPPHAWECNHACTGSCITIARAARDVLSPLSSFYRYPLFDPH